MLNWNWKVPPGGTSPELNMPLAAVAVWILAPAFLQTIVSATAMVTSLGTKTSSRISTSIVAAGAAWTKIMSASAPAITAARMLRPLIIFCPPSVEALGGRRVDARRPSRPLVAIRSAPSKGLPVRSFSAPGSQLVEGDGRGGGHVEGVHAGCHGDPHPVVGCRQGRR